MAVLWAKKSTTIIPIYTQIILGTFYTIYLDSMEKFMTEIITTTSTVYLNIILGMFIVFLGGGLCMPRSGIAMSLVSTIF